MCKKLYEQCVPIKIMTSAKFLFLPTIPATLMIKLVSEVYRLVQKVSLISVVLQMQCVNKLSSSWEPILRCRVYITDVCGGFFF